MKSFNAFSYYNSLNLFTKHYFNFYRTMLNWCDTAWLMNCYRPDRQDREDKVGFDFRVYVFIDFS